MATLWDIQVHDERFYARVQFQGTKLGLTCRKLGRQPGMRLLDIGCGLGAARYAAEDCGFEVVGIAAHGATGPRYRSPNAVVFSA